MRTRTWVCALSMSSAVAASLMACGDDTNTGGFGGDSSTTTTQSAVTHAVTSVTSTKAATTSSVTASVTVSTSSSSSSTGSGIVGSEDCPADPGFLLPRDPANNPGANAVVISDSTTGKTDDLQTFCTPDSTAGDVVYQFEIQDACTFDAKLEEVGAFDGAISFRSTCDARVGQYNCQNAATHGEEYKTFLQPGTYFVVVDGANGSEGDFSLTLDCAVGTCGDGVVGDGEQCDSGPGSTPGDGCGDPGTANACQLVVVSSADNCTGVSTISVAPGAPTYTPTSPPPFTTVGAVDDFVGSAACDLNLGGVDRVFQIQPTVSGTLNITIGEDPSGANLCDGSPSACWGSVLYLRDGACTTATPTELDCGFADYSTDPPSLGSVYTISAAVTAGNLYTLVVDGATSDPTFDVGPFFLKTELVP